MNHAVTDQRCTTLIPWSVLVVQIHTELTDFCKNVTFSMHQGGMKSSNTNVDSKSSPSICASQPKPQDLDLGRLRYHQLSRLNTNRKAEGLNKPTCYLFKGFPQL